LLQKYLIGDAVASLTPTALGEAAASRRQRGVRFGRPEISTPNLPHWDDGLELQCSKFGMLDPNKICK